MSARLVCPSCAGDYPDEERFCPSCGMPLVYADREQGPVSEPRRRARKIDPQYTEGRLVKIARAENRAQAEFISGMLLEEGIPCIERQTGGIVAPYAPELTARDLLVHESAVQAAREALAWEGK